MSQDFSKRLAIVVQKDLPSWQVLNTVAHIAAYLGNKMQFSFDTGQYFVTKDKKGHPRNSQYPIVIFFATAADLKKFIKKVRESGLLYLGFVPEMVETTNDATLERVIGEKDDSEMHYYGIGVFGENEKVKPLFKKFGLWK